MRCHERPRCKREQVCADGTCFLEVRMGIVFRNGGGISNDRPVRWMLYVETKLCFQIGLIEAWERHARVHGNEERVEVFPAIVLVLILSDRFARRRGVAGEGKSYGVLSGAPEQV